MIWDEMWMPTYRLNVWRLSELGEKDVQAYYVIMLNEIAETEHDMKFSIERGGGGEWGNTSLLSV